MKLIQLNEKSISTGMFQFIYPFSLKAQSDSGLLTFLTHHQYEPFQLNRTNLENTFYGDILVSHKELDQYFKTSIKEILFPPSKNIKGFRRFSKPVNKHAIFTSKIAQIGFQVHSIDVTVCPYELIFLTIRTEVCHAAFSDALEFASAFQKLQEVQINCEENNFFTTRSFILDYLFMGISDFFEDKGDDGIILTIDEEVYVQSLLSLEQSEMIDEVDVFRAGTLDGRGTDGKPYIRVTNTEYIKRYVKQYSYDAWQPDRYYFLADFCFTLLTNEEETIVLQLLEQAYGVIYYTFLLNLFYKFLFLKILTEYSKLKTENDKTGITKLIYMINSFTSNYFFLDHPFRMEGKELANLFRKSFNIDALYNATKEILFSLFKYEENAVTKRDSLLLLILTLFTVICGIFSMNLFTHDLVGKIQWSHFKKYNPFETFAVFIVFSGLMATFILLMQSLYQGMKNRKNRKKWFQQFFLGAKGQKKG